jgi:NAD(P)-dependent dehydrogenase (short-subunit alcohol dehydrogenase family)
MSSSHTIAVTGANTGIGYAITEALACAEHHVVLISRDAQKGQSALERMRRLTPAAQIELVIGDVGSIATTRQLAATLLERYPHLQVLVNNAGVWPTQRQLNEDGLECAFMVNHLAPFLLSRLLLERLQQNAPARIVNVNAGLYIKGHLNLEQTPYGHDFSSMKTYANTKLCNTLMTVELAQRLAGSAVTVNAVHPGVIRTNLGDAKGLLGLVMRVVKRFWGTWEEGARAPVWLATAPELVGVSGRYYFLQKEIELAPPAQDDKLARQLWSFSSQLTGLPEELAPAQ